MNKCVERLYNGIVKENPTFVLMLGMCPTLAVTTAAINGVGMGLASTAVLTLSNIMISMLRKVIPGRVRMPAFIVIVATFVTVVDFLMQAYCPPSLYDALGIYIPLIVVNCIILGRAEAYASKNPVLPSMFDGLGMGLGFTVGTYGSWRIQRAYRCGYCIRASYHAGFIRAYDYIHSSSGSFLRSCCACCHSEQVQE